MKRIIISVLLICLIAGISIFENSYINRFCDKKQKEIEVCRALYYSDREKSISKAKTFRKDWNKEQSVLIAFINHSYADGITNEVSKLYAYAENGESGEFAACCDTIHRTLEQIKDDQRITIDTFY